MGWWWLFDNGQASVTRVGKGKGEGADIESDTESWPMFWPCMQERQGTWLACCKGTCTALNKHKRTGTINTLDSARMFYVMILLPTSASKFLLKWLQDSFSEVLV